MWNNVQKFSLSRRESLTKVFYQQYAFFLYSSTRCWLSVLVMSHRDAIAESNGDTLGRRPGQNKKWENFRSVSNVAAKTKSHKKGAAAWDRKMIHVIAYFAGDVILTSAYSSFRGHYPSSRHIIYTPVRRLRHHPRLEQRWWNVYFALAQRRMRFNVR